jgi:hypothetical protein
MRDEGGAVMVVGLFMAVFAVGLVYTLMGIGETIAYQEEVQQVADTGAFSAAVTHARGMNTIGLVNRSISTTSATLSAFTIMDVAFSPVVCTLPHGACEEQRAYHASVRADVAPRAESLLRAATRAAERVAEITPILADAEVAAIGAEVHAERVRRAFLVQTSMPLSRGSLAPACALTNVNAFLLAREAMGNLLYAQTLGERAIRADRSAFQCTTLHVPGAGPLLPVPANLPVGTEAWQLRAIVLGNAGRVRGIGQGVRVPRDSIGRPATTERAWADVTDAERSTTLAIAQSEYYCDWPEANLQNDTELHLVEEDAFRMCWRGRLRRVRVPTGVHVGETDRDQMYAHWVEDAVLPSCGDACLPLLDLLSVAGDAIH